VQTWYTTAALRVSQRYSTPGESLQRRIQMAMYTALIEQIKEQKVDPEDLKALEGDSGKMRDFLSHARRLTESEVQSRKPSK